MLGTASARSVLFLISFCFASFLHAQNAASGSEGSTGLREVAVGATAFSRGTPAPAWADVASEIPAAASSDALVMRYAYTHFHAGAEPVAFIHRVAQANQPAALAELGQYAIVFQPEYQRVELHTLRVLRGGRSIDKLGAAQIRFLQREQELEAGVYTGAVSALVVSDDIRVGDTVEIAYSLIGQNPVFGGRFVEAAAWDSGIPVLWRRVTLDAPAERPIRYRMIGPSGSEDVKISESRSGALRTVRFEGRELPPVDQEEHVPRGVQPYRWIQFSEFASWRDVARWASELFTVPAAERDVEPVIAAARGARAPAETVTRALAFVQNEVRYLSTSFGENSHRPFPPAEVLARRYGDCKDKSLLLVSALRKLGVEAAPVLVSVQYRSGLEQMLPSPLVFDHAIVRAVVDGRSYFIDPTLMGQSARIDRMGQVHQGAQVLMVSRETSDFTTIPAVEAGQTEFSRHERVTVTRLDEPAVMNVRLNYSGVDAESLRRSVARMSRAQLRKAYEGSLDRRYPGASLVGDPTLADDSEENRIEVALQYRIPNFFEADKANWAARYVADNFRNLFFIPENAKRRQPLAVPSFPSVNRYDFEILLPENFDARRRPEQSVIRGRAFTLSQSLSLSGRLAKASLELRITSDRVEPADLVAFLSDLQKANQIIGGAFVVNRNDIKSAAPAPQLPFKQTVTARLEQIVRVSGEFIENAKIRGSDTSDALCERARALAHLGRASEAAADMRLVRQQAPDAAAALRCSGEIHFVLGDFAQSATDLSRALVLGTRDAEIYFQRGLSYYYLKRRSEAAEDFARSAEMAREGPLHARAAIWRTLALDASSARSAPSYAAASTEDSEWPAPALGLMRRVRVPDDVLREAHRETGERLETALAEAYLYLGQYYLLTGDSIRASVFFQRSIDKGALQAFYHASARHELAQLAKERPDSRASH